jgi:hypothetical protein
MGGPVITIQESLIENRRDDEFVALANPVAREANQ